MVYKVYNGYMIYIDTYIYIYNKCNAYTSGVECVNPAASFFESKRVPK
jgi:hypothetical protein